MSGTKIYLEVPITAYREVRRHCDEKYEDGKLHIGEETGYAMAEYTDEDGKGPVVEEKLDELLAEVGADSPETASKKKQSGGYSLSGERKKTHAVWVPEDVYAEFGKLAEKSSMPKGEVLGKAIMQYVEGGRFERMERKLDRALAAVEEEDDNEDLSQSERKLRDVCDRLMPDEEEIPDDQDGDRFQFLEEDLRDAINDIVARKPTAAPQTMRDWRQDVLDELGAKIHPKRDTLWCDAETAAEFAERTMPGTPEVCWRKVERLSDRERRRRVALELGKEVVANERRGPLVYPEEVRDEYLNGEVSKRDATELIESLAESHRSGFVSDVDERLIFQEQWASDSFLTEIEAYAEGVPLEEYKAAQEDAESDETEADEQDEDTVRGFAKQLTGDDAESDADADPDDAEGELDEQNADGRETAAPGETVATGGGSDRAATDGGRRVADDD